MTDRIRVAIVDDEHLARERLRRLIAQEEDLEVAGIAADGDAAIQLVIDEAPDLVFLDVQMPGRDGFSVVDALLERIPAAEMPLIVFITAFDQHALRAFEAQALDYLVKPFDDERFAALLERVRRLVRQARVEAATGRLRALLDGETRPREAQDEMPTAAPSQAEGRLEHLVLRSGSRSRVVKSESVDWIGADGVYARVHISGASYLLRVAMHELETRLDQRRFVRIHRSTIVNLDRVRELHEIDRGEYAVLLADGTKLKLSRNRRANLESRLGQRL
jgi:two-component system LytT family response regulator